MALTPMDIYNKEFGKGFRGYDEEEVDMFLDQVVDEYEKLEKANEAADEKIQSLNERLEHYKSLEGTLKETLVTAQNTAEEVVENARKKAALIIDSAQREARDIVERAGSQIEQAEKMDMELRKAAAVFKSRFVALLEAQLEFFRQETTDINAQRQRVQADAAPEDQNQIEEDREPAEPVVPEQGQPFSATAGVDEAPEELAPLQEREDPLTPAQSPGNSADMLQEREEPLTPVQSPVDSADMLREQSLAQAQPSELTAQQPEPVSFEQSEPVQEVQPETVRNEQSEPASESANTEPVQDQDAQNDTDYFGTSQPPLDPSDAAEEELDDADALIREIQHYSALRNDEDTVSDEGFIIGRDD